MAAAPLPLRAHMALCLQGWQGLGYSTAFAQRMGAVHIALFSNLSSQVQLGTRPDSICAACPNLEVAGCSLRGPGHEAHMRAQDEDVLARLGLAEGETSTWGDVLDRIARHVSGGDLAAICTTCPWLELGVCAAGIEALKVRPPASAANAPSPPSPDALAAASATSLAAVPPGKEAGARASKRPHLAKGAAAVTTPQQEPTAPRGQPQPSPLQRAAAKWGKSNARQVPDRALQDVWVARLRARDEDALREVVLAFSERLSAVVGGMLRDRDAIDDVVQETFAKAWYRIESFQGGSSLYTWLYRVAVNGAKDYLKGRRRRPAISFDDLPTRGHFHDGAQQPIEGLEQREIRERVRKALAALPQRFRAVLALREIEGMSYNEIAEALALSLGTVESRIFRARKRLRELLEAEQAAAAEREKRALGDSKP